MSGCGNKDKHNQDCLCEVVRAIKHAQDSVERSGDCDNNCLDLLGSGECNCHKNRSRHDTIPFFLQNDQGVPFITASIRERNSGCEVIFTPFFRVSKIKGCCATLELLDPGFEGAFSAEGGHSLAMFSSLHNSSRCPELRRTGKCITVDLNCFCSIQCLDPSFVRN